MCAHMTDSIVFGSNVDIKDGIVSHEQTLLQCNVNTFATFDLAVAKKAYALIWHDAERYKNVVIHSGVFHTVLSYLGALGKLMKGSGFEDIITEAGLCASGSLDKMMNVDIITEHLEYIPSCWKPLKDCSSLHLSKIQDQ
ncbi:hypothetical protein RRG08_024293 [Elysia crispata]|uniref:Uncharacterized protein n=1 Tax=Elysia crispata TaxID=231223 RepID=A0AAE0ZLG8_9GAST|nr:hypothetical protein RRG08_024293 [Elysia crispata]